MTRTRRILLLLTLITPAVQAATPDPVKIIDKAYHLKRVDDQTCKLTFTFENPGKAKQKVVYDMIWKNNKGKDGYANKVIFFTEYPPEKRGTGYLGWLRPEKDGEENNDEWIYLPNMHMTRRMSHVDKAHAHKDDEFGNSLLKDENLMPHPPESERHQFVAEQMLDGKPHYLIASEPKQPGKDDEHEPEKIIRWIGKDDHLIRRMQFIAEGDEQVLDMRIKWTRMGDYRVWKTVTATDPRNQAKTVMEISDIKINNGLGDNTFTKRVLEKGAQHLR